MWVNQLWHTNNDNVGHKRSKGTNNINLKKFQGSFCVTFVI